MATILEFELPPDEFALQEAFKTYPHAEIEIERVVADAPDHLTPYVWAYADDFDALEAAFEDDPTVKRMAVLAEMDDERSYQMTWAGPIDHLLTFLTDHEGAVTHAHGSEAGWNLRLLFPDHETLSQAHDSVTEAGFSLDIQAVYTAEDERHRRYGLTETQRTTLVTALQSGYFTVPREVSLTELAEQQDLSHQALSERLRRGMDNLVESTLLTQDEREGE